MIVVKPEQDAVAPRELMERVVLHALGAYTRVEVRRLSRTADQDREVRFVVATADGANDTVQVEVHAATTERGKRLPASIALFGGVDARPSELVRELAELLAEAVDGFVWEPDPRETERLRLPGADEMRDRRKGVRRPVAGAGAKTESGRHLVRDLSIAGMSFMANKPYATGELLPIELELPDEGGTVEMLLRVRWQTAPLASGQVPLGGEIVAIREDDRLRLDAYLEATER